MLCVDWGIKLCWLNFICLLKMLYCWLPHGLPGCSITCQTLYDGTARHHVASVWRLYVLVAQQKKKKATLECTSRRIWMSRKTWMTFHSIAAVHSALVRLLLWLPGTLVFSTSSYHLMWATCHAWHWSNFLICHWYGVHPAEAEATDWNVFLQYLSYLCTCILVIIGILDNLVNVCHWHFVLCFLHSWRQFIDWCRAEFLWKICWISCHNVAGKHRYVLFRSACFPTHHISWVSDWVSEWLSTWFFSMG